MSNLKLPTMTHKNLSKMLGKRPSLKLAYATEAHKEHGSDIITVTQHGNVIATLTPQTVHIDNCGYDTTTTATRLRKILSDNGITYYVRIKQYAMRLYNENHTELVSDFRSIEFANLSHAGQNWVADWVTLGEDSPAYTADKPAEVTPDLFAA